MKYPKLKEVEEDCWITIRLDVRNRNEISVSTLLGPNFEQEGNYKNHHLGVKTTKNDTIWDAPSQNNVNTLNIQITLISYNFILQFTLHD